MKEIEHEQWTDTCKRSRFERETKWPDKRREECNEERGGGISRWVNEGGVADQLISSVDREKERKRTMCERVRLISGVGSALIKTRRQPRVQRGPRNVLL